MTDEPEPQPGDLDDDLYPHQHVLGGVARSHRLIAIFWPDEPGLMLQREVWRTPGHMHERRWTIDPDHPPWGFSKEQTAKLLDVLADHPQAITLALCEGEALVLRPDQLYRFVVMPGCARCAELAKVGAP